MNNFYKSLSKTAIALSFFTALTSAAHAQAIIVNDGVVSDYGQDVVMVPERSGTLNPRGSIVDDKIGLTIQLGFSRVNVTSHEYIYDSEGGYGGGKYDKVSELIWQSKNVVMFGGKATIALASRVNFYGEAWINIHDKSQMDDYDWMDGKFTDWTHWSTHDDTELERGYNLDFALGFSALKTQMVTIDLLGGVKHDSWKWNAYGGNYIYSSAFSPEGFVDGCCFRDQAGFSEVGSSSISYSQNYTTPYLGMSADINLGRLNLTGKAIGSHWAKATNKDIHHRRNLEITHDQHNGKMYMLEGEASFAFSERFALGAGYTYTKYELTRGEDRRNGVVAFGDTSGSEQEYSKINIFVKSKF